MKILSWVLQQWNECKSLPDVNSRIAFLMHSVVESLCTFILCIAFIWKGNPSDFPWMISALAGVAGVSAWGRSMTKKAALNQPKEDEDDPTTTKPAASS
jgi:hypothetical protein